jgi:uncharacterized membrane protein YccC
VLRIARLKDTIAVAAARPDYAAGLRAATATILPLAIGEATHRPQFVWMALGGWMATFADPGGPYPLRATTLLAYVAAASTSVAAGAAVAGRPWLAVPLLFAWAVLCSMSRIYGEAAGGVGAAALIAFCIALGTPAPSAAAVVVRAGLYAAGGLWAAGLALALWPLHPYQPVREAVAACHRAIAARLRELAADGPGWFESAARGRAATRALLETARAVVGTVRSGRSGESRRGELLVALYEAADLALGDLSALAETLQSRADRGLPRDESLRHALERLADTFDEVAGAVAGGEPRTIARGIAAGEDEPAAIVDRLSSHAQLALAAAAALQGRSTWAGVRSAPVPAPAESKSLRDVLSLDSLELRHALRVAFTATAAAVLGLTLHSSRSYWIVVTAVIVLQPHAGATVRKGLQRIAGTVAGAMAAALLAPVAHGPLLAAFLLFVLALAAVALRRTNYAVFAALVTPLFVLMAESFSGDWNLASMRVTSTLLGGAVALVGSYALWPNVERGRLPATLAAVLRRAKAVVRAALEGAPLAPARREAGVTLANADAAFERFLDEAHRDDEVEALMAIRSQTRRLLGAVAALSASGTLPRETAAQVERSLEELAAAIERRAPPPPLPAFPPGAEADRIVRPVEIIHSAVSRLPGD